MDSGRSNGSLLCRSDPGLERDALLTWRSKLTGLHPMLSGWTLGAEPSARHACTRRSSALFDVCGCQRQQGDACFSPPSDRHPVRPALAFPCAATSHCNWPGVTCDAETSRVRSLVSTMTGGPLSGPLDPFDALQALEELSLGHSMLSGTLPAEWGSLPRLSVVDLRHNALTGPLPASWSQSDALRYETLSYNNFTVS